MVKNQKIAFKTLKNEFDRFPNVELTEAVELGQIGFYDGKKSSFEWRTSLASLEVSITPSFKPDPPPIVDEIYTSANAVKFEFSFGEDNIGKVIFSFSKKYAIATQANDMISKGYEIAKLEDKLLEFVKKGGKWEKDWVIVTQIFSTPSFSLLISSGKGGYAEISTQVPIKNKFFNIADPKLNLAISKSRFIGYRSLAKQNVTPFFRVHKLIGDFERKKLRLSPYGR